MTVSNPSSQQRVGFLLPSGAGVPVGGVKVVLEYANALVARGWGVTVAMPHLIDPSRVARARASPLARLKASLSFANRRLRGGWRPDPWFRVDPRVELAFLPTPEALPHADAWVASAWQTAPWVAALPGARLYLIQHLETWAGSEPEVVATWKLPLRKVVIAQWLADFAAQHGETAEVVRNGLDFEVFGLDAAPETRAPHRVLMLFHTSEWKGSKDGLVALELAKREHPPLEATLFGVTPRPAGLPEWIAYEQRPAQRRLRALYNEAAIFLAPSRVEGFGLPPAEAMACGAAVAATDVGGHREFARHEETSLLSPPLAPAALAANVLRLVRDPAARARLARAGHAYIRTFTWDAATTRFEAILRDELAKTDALRRGVR